MILRFAYLGFVILVSISGLMICCRVGYCLFWYWVGSRLLIGLDLLVCDELLAVLFFCLEVVW